MGDALNFASADLAARGAAQRILPSDRVLPSIAAAESLRTTEGPYDFDLAPMMREPLDELAGRTYQGIVMVAPQRSSKTSALILGGLAYIVTKAPGDTMIVHVSREAARNFSLQDLGRTIAASPELAAARSPTARDDNLLNKRFRSGMDLYLSWPTATQLAARTVRYAFITDYDRPENRDNVDGQGPLWDLTIKRVETFMSRGKCLAESSPGSEVVDAAWRAPDDQPHAPPPTRGIVSVYGSGTRARWYWRCPHCGGWFQCSPGYDLFRLPDVEQLAQRIRDAGGIEGLVERYSVIPCIHCGVILRQEDKARLNAGGRWLHEGEHFKGDQIVGERRRSNIWSGWLGGAGASFQRWDSVIRNYLAAVERWTHTGDEAPLRLVSLSDVAMPYTPLAQRMRRTAKVLKERARIWPRGRVPAGVRFLTAAADVQSSRFVIQVEGWGEGLEHWLIDRYEISSSQRIEGSQGERFAAIQPASYLDDWRTLEAVIERRYPVDGGGELRPLVMFVDAGGRAGVTANAYAWWRELRRETRARGAWQRIQLVRGDGRLNAQRVLRTLPDTRKRKTKKAGAKGDVPVWLVNTNVMKDQLAGELARQGDDDGPRAFHLPEWIATEMPHVLDEFVAEVRTEKGWRNPAGKRNESTDLAVYNRSAMIAIGGEAIDWSNPPSWAAPVVGIVGQGTIPRERRRRRSPIRTPGAEI